LATSATRSGIFLLKKPGMAEDWSLLPPSTRAREEVEKKRELVGRRRELDEAEKSELEEEAGVRTTSLGGMAFSCLVCGEEVRSLKVVPKEVWRRRGSFNVKIWLGF